MASEVEIDLCLVTVTLRLGIFTAHRQAIDLLLKTATGYRAAQKKRTKLSKKTLPGRV